MIDKLIHAIKKIVIIPEPKLVVHRVISKEHAMTIREHEDWLHLCCIHVIPFKIVEFEVLSYLLKGLW